VKVRAHDPAVKGHADELRGVELADTAESALRGADVGVLATPWPEYRTLTPAQLRAAMKRPRVIDPTHFLAAGLANDPTIAYVAAGRAA
jgi:UDP-glucose 6-dehydrogenase